MARMTEKEWASNIAELIKEYVAKHVGPLRSRIVHLEEQIGELEKDPAADIKVLLDPMIERLMGLEERENRSLADSFEGPWLPQKLYRRGALVQHNGSAWLALANTEGKPGEAEGWRLLVRGGAR